MAISINYVTTMEGNLLNIPSGKPFSDVPVGQTCDPSSMIDTTIYPNEYSQFSFYHRCKDLFGEKITCKIFRAGQHYKTYSGDIEVVRGKAYKEAINVGATLGRRKGKSPNKDYKFEITAA